MTVPGLLTSVTQIFPLVFYLTPFGTFSVNEDELANQQPFIQSATRSVTSFGFF